MTSRTLTLTKPFLHCGKRFTPTRPLRFRVRPSRGNRNAIIYFPGIDYWCIAEDRRALRRKFVRFLCSIWHVYAIYDGPMDAGAHELAAWLRENFTVEDAG